MTIDVSPPPDTCPRAEWITQPQALQDWLDAVADGDVIGMDTEFLRRNTYYSQLSLLQLAHRDRYVLVDPLAFDLADILQRHLGARAITCVMHSAGEDIETLAPWLPEGPAQLFDTQLAAAFVGLGHGLGYRALVARLCGVDLDKGETRSDWTRRPLSAAQKRYATLDVVYLEPLHRQLASLLEQRGNRNWFQADCRRLRQRARLDALPAQPQCDLSAAASWPHDRQALVRRVLRWRERTARELDKPRNWLLDAAQVLELVQHVPHDLDELFQLTRGQRALRGRQRQQLLEQLQAPLGDEEIAATDPIPARPAGPARDAVHAMKDQVNALADELDLPPGLLCPRKMLEAYVTTRQWPAGLDGWRHDLLQPQLQPLLPA